jgi:hypothetical protein
MTERWYVVAHRVDADPDDSVWTLSNDPNEPGWDTARGLSGYGMLKSTAQWLCDAANETIARDGHDRWGHP